MSQTILSNFDFQTPDPPDLAWHKLGPNFFFKFFVIKVLFNFFLEFFSSINEYWCHKKQKVIQIQNNLNQNAFEEITTLFVTACKLKKFHQISKFPKPKCILGHFEQLWFLHPGPPPPPDHHHQKWKKTTDLAWHKLGLKIFFSKFLFKFCSNFWKHFFLLLMNIGPTRTKSHPNSK